MKHLSAKGLQHLLVGALAVAIGGSGLAEAAHDHLKGFPLALVCGQGQQVRMPYLSDMSTHGDATYRSAESKLALKVTTEGEAKTALTVVGRSVCLGRTLAQYREAGRAVESAR